MDYAKQYPVAMKAITEWIGKGLLKRKFHIVNGLDAAPSALPLLYSGGNTGKLCVVFFTLSELVSYSTLPGSLRSLITESHPSFELCNHPHAVIYLLISTALFIVLRSSWYSRVELGFFLMPFVLDPRVHEHFRPYP